MAGPLPVASARALRYAVQEEDFLNILSAGVFLVFLGTPAATSVSDPDR
jgi:hypothetical protein